MRKPLTYRPKVCPCGATFRPTNGRQIRCVACRVQRMLAGPPRPRTDAADAA